MKAIRIRRAQFALAAALTCLAASAFADQSHFSYTLGVGATRTIAVPEVNTNADLGSCSRWSRRRARSSSPMIGCVLGCLA